MIEPTDEMHNALYPLGPRFKPDIRKGLPILLAIAERDLRAAIAADIAAALSADEADSDVSSGEAIWEQGGYRNGLSDAADIARGTP